MAHKITIKEIVNGVEITETIGSNILISVLSYNAKPFFRSTNEDDVESFQIIDRIGEIYHLPALATEFTLIDINNNYFIPANGEKLIEYSYKIRVFRSENEFDKVLNVGTVEATANTVKVNIPSVGLPNSVLINGSVYENYYPSLFNFVAVVEFTKILIVYAKPDSTVFYLAQGVESLSAVEPDYEGLFVARLIVSVSGIVIEEGGNKPQLISTDDSILIEENDIGAMLSFFYEEFSNHDIILRFTPMVILGVYKNGLLLNDDEFILVLPKNIVINNYTTNDKIKIQYQHLKTDLYEYNISN